MVEPVVGARSETQDAKLQGLYEDLDCSDANGRSLGLGLLVPARIGKGAPLQLTSTLNPSRLTLGTAQLGSSYGIANHAGRPTDIEVRRILDTAWREGITCFDTATAYGDAELRIGEWCAATGHRPLLISKLPAIQDGGDSPGLVRTRIDAACHRLGVKSLDGFLVHRFVDIRRPTIIEGLRQAVEDGQIGAFGASLYHPQEALEALRISGLGLLQMPISLFDRRFVHHGLLDQCREQKVIVFARSIFLQGCLLMEPDRLPLHLRSMGPDLRQLRHLAERAGETILRLALAAINRLPAVSSLIVGAETDAQLRQITAAARQPFPPDDIVAEAWQVGKDLPEELINPALWPKSQIG